MQTKIKAKSSAVRFCLGPPIIVMVHNPAHDLFSIGNIRKYIISSQVIFCVVTTIKFLSIRPNILVVWVTACNYLNKSSSVPQSYFIFPCLSNDHFYHIYFIKRFAINSQCLYRSGVFPVLRGNQQQAHKTFIVGFVWPFPHSYPRGASN